MQDDCECPFLMVFQFSQPDDNRLDGVHGHTARLSAPTLVGRVIDVAISAVEIATTGDLEKNRIDCHVDCQIISMLPPAIVAIMHASVGAGRGCFFQNILNQPLQGRTGYFLRVDILNRRPRQLFNSGIIQI